MPSDSAEILRALGTKHNPQILAVTHEPLDADEISERADVPIGTTYRRINQLTEVGLLNLEDRILSDEHRRRAVYRRNIDAIKFEFSTDQLSAVIEERTSAQNKLDDIWRTLGGEE